MTRLAFPLADKPSGDPVAGLPVLVSQTVRRLNDLGVHLLLDRDEEGLRAWCSGAEAQLPPGVRLIPVALATKGALKAGDHTRLEFHQTNIDVHVCLHGRERLARSPLDTLTVNEPWQADQDVGFGVGAVTDAVDLAPGEGVVFLPDDAHMPLFSELGPGPVRKLVVKIPVAP